MNRLFPPFRRFIRNTSSEFKDWDPNDPKNFLRRTKQFTNTRFFRLFILVDCVLIAGVVIALVINPDLMNDDNRAEKRGLVSPQEKWQEQLKRREEAKSTKNSKKIE